MTNRNQLAAAGHNICRLDGCVKSGPSSIAAVPILFVIAKNKKPETQDQARKEGENRKMIVDIKRFWRFTYCGGYGGMVLADTKEEAMSKLQAKYGEKETTDMLVWAWESDDYYDAENPDILNIYDC